MADLEPIILNDLRTAGPWQTGDLRVDLQRRVDMGLIDGLTGMVSYGSVLTALERLRSRGRAETGPDGWAWLPERVAKPTGRVVQAALFD